MLVLSIIIISNLSTRGSQAAPNQANGILKNATIVIIFTISDTKLYFPVVTLSAKENQERSKLLGKGLERSGYWNEYKTKK